MSVRFDDRVAVVTGAGSGLGRLEALALAERGAKVLVNDYAAAPGGAGASAAADRVAEEIRGLGGEAAGYGADVADEAAINRMVAETIDRWGRIDILVNNAGVLQNAAFQQMEIASFRRVLDVHLVGSALCARAVWPHMREARYGRVLMTTSSAGLFGSWGQANYSAAKMGLVGLMHTLQIEGQKHGIRVNGLSPAAVTPMNEALLPEHAQPYMRPEAVVPAALYLLSDDAPARTIVTAAAGGFARVEVRETAPIFLPPEQWTPEDVGAVLASLSDRPAEVAFESSFAQVQAYVERAARAGIPSQFAHPDGGLTFPV